MTLSNFASHRLLWQTLKTQKNTEPVIVNVYEVHESIPPGWELIPGILKGLQIRAQVSIYEICRSQLSECGGTVP